MMKYLGIIVTIVLAVISGAVGYGQLQSNQAKVINDVAEVETEVKEHDDKIHELEKFSVQQTILIQNVQENIRQQNMIQERMLRLLDTLETRNLPMDNIL